MKRARSYSQPYSTRNEPAFWEQYVPRKALNAQSERISLRPEATVPNKRQYPMKLETKKGLQLLIHKFLHGLLNGAMPVSMQYSYFPVIKPTGESRVVQDLRAGNDAVGPIHPLWPILIKH